MSRRLGGAGKPARPILAAWAAREGAGFPAKRAASARRGAAAGRKKAPAERGHGRAARPEDKAWAGRKARR